MRHKYAWAAVPLLLAWLLLMGYMADNYDPHNTDYTELPNATK